MVQVFRINRGQGMQRQSWQIVVTTAALPRAQGYKLQVNRGCDMQGLCLAFRPLEAVYGNQDQAPLVQLNLSLVRAKLADEKK